MDLLVGARDFLLQLQVVEYTFVEDLFRGPARAQLVVFLLEAFVVQFELVKTILVQVVQHGNGTSRDPSALF
ncbi:hypothetical protein METSCH_D08350 [Metschnikowia aff. pulcherrima]|uniref:Uncharacterized protein n=1 Tax=Metschnikowia aff. pulcherrima TaxID=2163413 RepID=A0A4V1AEM7_9ASCO|nr:hypothetical protein METSCH_D08350 [Metschnikowia aff. pulcherrima]